MTLTRELSPKVGDGGTRKVGISWGCLTPSRLHRCSTAVSWCKDTPSITHLDRRHAQNGERRHLIHRAIGQRYRYELLSLSSAQAEVGPPAEDHAGGDAMAAANLCHAGTGLLGLLHDRSLLLVAEATAVRPPVRRFRCHCDIYAARN
jgi:hypothetical protein